MKKFNLFKMLAVLIVLITSINTAWGWSKVSLRGSMKGIGWDPGYAWDSESGEESTETYAANGDQFKLYIHAGVNDYVGYCYSGPDSKSSISSDGTASHLYKDYGGNQDQNVEYSGCNGIVCFHYKNKDQNDHPLVWITRPTVYLKNHWNTSPESWSWKSTTDEGNGYYYVDAAHGANGVNWGTNGTSAWQKNSTDVYISCTPSPSTLEAGRKCRYRLNTNPSGSSWDAATPTLTITGYYYVTFNMKGHGSAPSDIEVLYNNIASAPTAPTADGYTFGGWYTDNSCTTPYNWSSAVTADIELYAKWTEKSYSLTFTTDGHGTVAVGGVDVASGSTASVNHHTTKTLVATNNTGYNFSSWTLSGSNTSAVTIGNTSNASTTIKTSNTGATVRANFSAKNYTVTLDDNGGTEDGSATATYNATSLGSISAPTKAGYHPEGYYTNAGCSIKVATPAGVLQNNVTGFTTGTAWTLDDDVTLHTKWTANTYYVRFNRNSGDATGTMSNQEFTYDASATALTTCAFTRTGYTFAGWATSAGGSVVYDDKDAVSNLTSDENGIVDLYAKWTANKYTITLEDYSPDSWGTYLTGGCDTKVDNFVVEYNTKYFDCYLNEGPTKVPYDFNGWYSGEGGAGDQIVSAYGALASGSTAYTDGDGKWNYAGDPTIYAKWTLRLSGYSDIKAPTGALYSAGTITFTYKSSSTSEFTAATRTGYTLDGYYTAEDGVKVVNANGTLVANVTGWTNSDGEWIYSESSTPSLYTKWTANTYTVAFAKNTDASYYSGTDTGTDPDNITATYGETFTFPANPYTRTNYHFIGWSRNKAQGADNSSLDYDYERAAGASSIGNYSSEQGATVTFYPKWRGDVHTVSFNPRGGYISSGSSDKSVNYGEAYGELPTAAKSGGYEFAGWYTEPDGAGSLVTAETKVSATGNHTLYAHYTKVHRVYFKNVYGWSNVYVTFDATWDGSQGAGNKGKTYRTMSRISGTDIWYHDIPASYLSSWAWYIAFNNTYQSEWYAFTEGEAVFRMDFDSIATMFVPTNIKTNNTEGNYQKNGVQYYSTGYKDGTSSDPEYTSGYWRVYRDEFSGYTLSLEKNGTGSWSPGVKFKSPGETDSIFAYTVTLEANTQYNIAIYKKRGTSNDDSDQYRYDSEINSGNCTNLKLACKPQNGWMRTTVAGDYTFTLTMKADGHMYLSIKYPFGVNDYKVVYSYTKGSAQTFESEYIKASPSTKDTISMFIHSGDSATLRSLTIHKCTGISDGVATWNTSYATITLPDTTVSGKTSGVYNFIIEQDAESVATGSYWKKYDGNYYIRTDSAAGGWDLYKYRADNIMTLSEYSLTQTLSAPYSHYYCRYTRTADISYTIATDYSPKICPVMTDDATIGTGNKTLPAGHPANIRFSWNEETNATRRAYLKSATGAGNTRFLVMHGADNKLRDSEGNTIAGGSASLDANELLFDDKGNWIYELEIQAVPGAKVSIIAQYNSVDRPLVGDAGSEKWETILGGSGSTPYPMRAVYDFKTNRLMTAWIPSGTITEMLSNVDVLIERHNQEGATTITFGKASKEAEAGSISAKRVIGALRFDYSELVGNVRFWTPETRGKMMFFISFPFDVNVSDIFGLNSSYGQAYIVQKYNGALRAEKGFFLGDGTTSFWEILPVDSVMHAGQGYVVTMDNDYLNGDKGHVWDNKKSGDHVHLYFPSANDPKKPITINSDAKTITVPAHECKINRTFGKLNHKYTDSNWNLMGVPVFQNHTGDATAGTPGAIFTASEEPSDTTDYKEHPDLGYFYQWGTDKNYTIRSAVGFTFLPMHSYMVQYAGDVKFTCAEPSVVPASVAPRRTPMTENYNIELQVLNSNDEMLNHTYVELRENAIDTFAVNEDTYMLSNSKDVNVYTFAGAYDVAANVLSIGSHVVPVGVIVNRAGTYTFLMPSNFSGNVTLVDNVTGIHTNLALSDYTVDLTTGTNDNRFYLEIDINKTPTSIDVIEEGGSLKDGKAHKFIENGVMYILKDGVIYDAQGNRVK